MNPFVDLLDASKKKATELTGSAIEPVRNKARELWAKGFHGIIDDAKNLGQHSKRGLAPSVSKELQDKTAQYYSSLHSSGVMPSSHVRVAASQTLTNRPGASTSFVGIGLDENIPTRMLKDKTLMSAITKSEAEDNFSIRSRTCDLVWAASDPNSSEPITGHTPAIKKAEVKGTAEALTAEHNIRDQLREKAIDRTLADASSPAAMRDTRVMASLATIKYMSSPAEELETKRAAVQALPTPRFAAILGAGNRDVRQNSEFNALKAHIQEARETKKWETASAMTRDPRLANLVPNITRRYLAATGNDPIKARDSFRSDLHGSYLAAPPVNRAKTSQTDDLTTNSLHKMATAPAKGRPRALSNPRMLAPKKPQNSRGDH